MSFAQALLQLSTASPLPGAVYAVVERGALHAQPARRLRVIPSNMRAHQVIELKLLPVEMFIE